jgi:hypothetical protein
MDLTTCIRISKNEVRAEYICPRSCKLIRILMDGGLEKFKLDIDSKINKEINLKGPYRRKLNRIRKRLLDSIKNHEPFIQIHALHNS